MRLPFNYQVSCRHTQPLSTPACVTWVVNSQSLFFLMIKDGLIETKKQGISLSLRGHMKFECTGIHTQYRKSEPSRDAAIHTLAGEQKAYAI